jgi:hypothetical protein
MTEQPPDKSTYGKLVWPKFYGRSVIYQGWYRSIKIVQISVCIASPMFILLGIYLFATTGIKNIIAEGFLGLSGSFLPALFWYAYHRDMTSMDSEHMEKRGDLDWDLYENGILERHYSDESPNHILEDFDFFSKYPKVYFNVGDHNTKQIWEHIKNVARKARELDGGEYREGDFVWDNDQNEFLKTLIWFLDGTEGQEDFELDRDCVRDLRRFESILRQKVKVVE